MQAEIDKRGITLPSPEKKCVSATIALTCLLTSVMAMQGAPCGGHLAAARHGLTDDDFGLNDGVMHL